MTSFLNSRLLRCLVLHLGACAAPGWLCCTWLAVPTSQPGFITAPVCRHRSPDGAQVHSLQQCQTVLLATSLQAPVSTLSAGFGLILGLNGAIWVSTQQHQTTAVPSGAAAAHEGLVQQQQQKKATMLTREERSRVVRVATCIRALAKLYLLVYPATILETFQVGWALIRW